jgi:hypothetical protein
MRSVHIENIGDMAVIECEDRVVRSEAAFKLREAVTRNEMRESLCLISRKCAPVPCRGGNAPLRISLRFEHRVQVLCCYFDLPR